MTLYYEDPELGTVALKSRTISDEHIGAHDVTALPGTVEVDIGQSKGYLATLAGAVAGASVKAVLQAGTAAIGKLAANVGVNIGTVDVASSRLTPVATAVVTNVNASASSVQLLAANAARIRGYIHNDSTAVLTIKYGTTASAASRTTKLAAGDTWNIDDGYTGRIDGLWASATGSAAITEMTP